LRQQLASEGNFWMYLRSTAWTDLYACFSKVVYHGAGDVSQKSAAFIWIFSQTRSKSFNKNIDISAYLC